MDIKDDAQYYGKLKDASGAEVAVVGHLHAILDVTGLTEALAALSAPDLTAINSAIEENTADIEANAADIAAIVVPDLTTINASIEANTEAIANLNIPDITELTTDVENNTLAIQANEDAIAASALTIADNGTLINNLIALYNTDLATFLTTMNGGS